MEHVMIALIFFIAVRVARIDWRNDVRPWHKVREVDMTENQP